MPPMPAAAQLALGNLFPTFQEKSASSRSKEKVAHFPENTYTSRPPPDVHVVPAFRFQRAPNSANIELRSSSEHSDKFRDSQPKSGEQGVDEILVVCHSHSAEVPGGETLLLFQWPPGGPAPLRCHSRRPLRFTVRRTRARCDSFESWTLLPSKFRSGA
jgi:hypothetical protein